jgi:hypothetical protein
MIMFRLVYFDPAQGYGAIDSNRYNQIMDTDNHLKQEGKEVICIVDYDQKMIDHKSADYRQHRDNIDNYIFDYEFLNS